MNPARTSETVGTSAFTLIELLIVVIIVGILAGAAAPLYLAQADRARTAEAVACLATIRTMMTAYRANHGHYPEDLGSLGLGFGDNAFFAQSAFSVEVVGEPGETGYTFFAIADGGAEDNDAPRASEVANFLVQMNRQGMVRYSEDGGSAWNTEEGDWSDAPNESARSVGRAVDP